MERRRLHSPEPEDALYDRHLVFDRAIDPKVASARERFEAFPILCVTFWRSAG